MAIDEAPMHLRAPKLLPAWFVHRMIDSIGDFAFLLTTGDVVNFMCIGAIRQDVTGELWIDVILNPKSPLENTAFWCAALIGGVDDANRGNASIQARHIVAAVDLTQDDQEAVEIPPEVVETPETLSAPTGAAATVTMFSLPLKLLELKEREIWAAHQRELRKIASGDWTA
jgi:hypothetical protein